MSAQDKHDWTELREALAATLAATNVWLQQTYPDSGLQLELVAKGTARHVAMAFNEPSLERLVDWDWEQLFFKKVQYQKNMWMFAITMRGQYGAACLGTINITDDYVSIEYLERHAQAQELRSLTTLIAIQYIEALADYFEMTEVRICDPDPNLLAYYETNFCFVRHEAEGAVPYLYKVVKP